MKNILLLLFVLPLTLDAQTSVVPCYAESRDKGIEYMNRKDYGEAITQFVAALVTCKDVPPENDLSKRIEESKRRWANDLQASVTEAQKAYREAVAAKNVAESAKTAEVEARKTAEENAQKALDRGVRSESFRLALLSDVARQEGRKTDALLLSWMGVQLSDSIPSFVMHAFGEAVRDSFTTSFFNSPDEITSAQYLSDGQHVLLQTSALTFFLIHLTEPVGITQLPPQIIHAVASPAGNRILAWGNTTNVLVINADGKTESTLDGHTESIRDALFSPDGQTILTCSRDNTARLWDSRGKLIRVLGGHAGNVHSGGFSPDGTLTLTRSADGSAKIWDSQGNLLRTLRDTSSFVFRAFFSNSNAVFVQQSNGTIKTWNKDGVPVNTTETEPLYVRFVVPSPDAEFVAARSSAKQVIIFDADGHQKAKINQSANLYDCNFSSSSRNLITWGDDHVARLWDMNGNMMQDFVGHRKAILSATYDAKRKQLLTTSSDGTSKLWDASGNILTEWSLGSKTPVEAVFSPSGDRILTIGEGGKSASLSPLPLDVYQKTDRASLLKSSQISSVIQAYNIQFLEKLGIK